MSDQPAAPRPPIDQSGQTVHGPQTTIAGGVTVTGGLLNTGTINTGGGDLVAGDKHVNTTWPRVATGAAFIALLTFALLLIELATNWVERLSGLSLQALLIIAGLIAALAWGLALWMLLASPPDTKRRIASRNIHRQRFTSETRLTAQAIVIGLPILVILVATAYYTWRILPARYTTILLADFVAPSGTDEALVTQTLAAVLKQSLANYPTLRIKRLQQVIEAEGGDEYARRLGTLPEHKATIVIWGNYAIVAGDPEVHLHFTIVQPMDTYLAGGFFTSYGPEQISQMVQMEQPTMFDFKLALGTYLSQMSAFTAGLVLYNVARNSEAIPLFETASGAIGLPMSTEFEQAIRFYRGSNYLQLDRVQDAKPDFLTLIPYAESKSATGDFLAIATLSNLGVVAKAEGNYLNAKYYFEQALALYTAFNYPLGQANQLGNLGRLARIQGHYIDARRYSEQALALHTEMNDLRGQALDWGSMGLVAQAEKDYAKAKHYHEQALALHTALDDTNGQANELNNLGLVARLQSDDAAARRYHEQALALFTELGNPLGQANQLGNLGNVAADQGNYTAARRYHEQALATHIKLGYPLNQARDLSNLAVVALLQGDPNTARDYLTHSAALYQSMGLPIPPELEAGLTALESLPKDAQ